MAQMLRCNCRRRLHRRHCRRWRPRPGCRRRRQTPQCCRLLDIQRAIVETECVCTCRCHSEGCTLRFVHRWVGCSSTWRGECSCRDSSVQCQPPCPGSCVDSWTQTCSAGPRGHVVTWSMKALNCVVCAWRVVVHWQPRRQVDLATRLEVDRQTRVFGCIIQFMHSACLVQNYYIYIFYSSNNW